jgi:CheY-like chemotaxis protein
MMEQVVMNLCINARDAMPKGGTLTLSNTLVELKGESKQNSNSRPGSFVCLSIGDTGCGMDEAVLSKIFEPFFSTKEVGKGTGLGLATVYGIVKQHEGWVDVESKVGKGSLFRVYLPACARPLQGPPVVRTEEKTSGGSETILLVEDEPAVRRTVGLSLRKLGYAVLEAANGVEAIKVWEEHHQTISLLFSDMIMPGSTSGLDLAQRLRKEKPSLKVIISSGYSDDLAEPSGPEREIHYLPKPFRSADMAKVIRHCLDQI